MATYRKVQRRIRDEAGNVVGGTNFEVRVYSAFAAGTLAAVKLDSAGADVRPNPGYPNSGWQCKLTTQLLGTDASAIVDSTAGLQVGDVFPIVDGLFFHYLVVKAIPDATHITLEQTSNAAGSPTGDHTYPIGAVLGDPAMLGHWQGYVDVVQDYDLTVKNVAQGKESNPDQLFTTQTIGVISFQDEGVSTGSARGTLNIIGPFFAIVDNAGANRVDLTLDVATMIAAGTNAGRPAAAIAGKLYVATDAPIICSRDNGATWLTFAFQNPMTAIGDTIYGGASGAQTRLAPSGLGQALIGEAGAAPAWQPNFYVLDRDVTTTTVGVSSVAEADLYRKTIPANLLTAAGGLRLRCVGDGLGQNTGGGVVTHTLRVKFGATTIFSQSRGYTTSVSARYAWEVDIIMLQSATNAQRWFGRLFMTEAASSRFDNSGSTTAIAYATSAEDTTANKDIAVTGQVDTNTANVDIDERFAELEVVRA